MNSVNAFFSHLIGSLLNKTSVDWSRFEGLKSEDWLQLYALSVKQGVVAVLYDTLRFVPKNIAPPKELLLKWLSHTLSIEKQMMKKRTVAIEFAENMAEKNIPVVVLKGIAFASYFPNPSHREFGDFDCYMMGKKEEGDIAAIVAGAMKEDASYKHSHLYYKGLMIENHRYLTSFDNSKQGIKTELILKDLIGSNYSYIDNTKLILPSAIFNAIFLVKHAQRHFLREGICIRHLLDWAFFLKTESVNVDWCKAIPIMEECRILNFAKVMTSLCVDKFGVVVDIPGLKGSMEISDAVFAEILSGYPNPFHENLMQKVVRITRRFYRMWKFRSLADESYFRLLWNNIVSKYYFKIIGVR